MQHHDATTTQRIDPEKFQHDQLDHSKECIRLLRFVDQPSSSEHDHFELETYDVATAPRYVALSYTWGYGRQTYDIIVNKLPLPIGKNLRVALKALQSFFRNDRVVPDKSRPGEDERVSLLRNLLREIEYPLMWIDAICINQDNVLEKSHQVNMMGRIFTAADYVISWLGEEADNSRCVMTAIRTSTNTRYCSVQVEQAMKSFVRRSYWKRMWIVQEFILARNVVILCGQEGAWWKDLVHFWHDTKLVRCAEGVRELNKGISRTYPPKGLSALIFARRSRGDNIFAQIAPLSMHQLMATFSYGECSDRRDRIYALLALIKPKAGVEPFLADYMISAEKLYYKFLGHAGQLDYSRNTTWFRRELRKALDSFAWTDTETAKIHEAVSEIVEVGYSHKQSLSDCNSATEQRVLFTNIQKCLAKHLGKPVDGKLCEEDWTYDDLIRHFQAFPRCEDSGTWRRFDSLLLSWLEILSSISNTSPRADLSSWSLGDDPSDWELSDDSSDGELGFDISTFRAWRDPSDSPEFLAYLDAAYISGEISSTRPFNNFA